MDPWGSVGHTSADGPPFLQELLNRVDELRSAAARRPYWSERRGGATRGSLTFDALVRAACGVITQLADRGYFEERFEKDCVDSPSSTGPDLVIEQECGRPRLWSAAPADLANDKDAFFDLIEVLHDLVSRPRSRWMHSYASCGWHHGDFSRGQGQAVLRTRLNDLFDRSDVGLHLADEGEDVGRLIEVTDDARAELMQRMAQRTDPSTRDRVRHAIALFRARAADVHNKRSAATALALVLEERRELLRSELLAKDESALFHIANQFAVRHQNDKQQHDYDEAFRDWIFWWYLATIELTDRLIARQTVESQ